MAYSGSVEKCVDKITMMEIIPEGFSLADFRGPYLQNGGPYYVKKQGESYLVALRVEDKHTNYMDIAHGGVLSTLADVALSWQVYLSEQPNPAVTTTSLTTNFLASAKKGDWLVAAALIDRLGKRAAHVHGSISCEGKLLVTMTGVFNIFRSAE
jgi:acyl-coenzyme A thioesterase 13